MADITPTSMGAPDVNITAPHYPTSVTKEEVERKINDSKSLVEALESVAAMYNIPAENIIVDDTINSIRVAGDNIITPDRKNPSANTQAIVCAIGAVLDNISQRIDSKLTQYQSKQIEQNKTIANQKQPDPSKGDVIGRYFASDGSEIIAYSSGLVDMDNTHAANEKVRELRASKQIPDFTMEPSPKKSSSYFTAEDDIMNGVKTNDNIKMNIDKQAHDISMKINESAYFIDLMDKFYGTTTLGHDLLQSQGFDYVQETHAYIQEADGEGKISSSDLKHMRFDNTHLMKAVELFNAARLEMSTDSFPGMREICRNDKFKAGLKEIETQFDCHLDIRFFDTKDPHTGEQISDGFTQHYNDINQKITVSKSKGFQLHGTPIFIIFAGEIFKSAPSAKELDLFGQSVMSIILHEIYHNISDSLRKENDQFIFTMSSGIMLAASTKNMRNRRKILSNCVNTLAGMTDGKMNRSAKRKMVKSLMAIVANKYELEELEHAKETAENSNDLTDLDAYIKKMEKIVKKSPLHNKKKKKTGRILGTIGCAVGGAIGVFMAIFAPWAWMNILGVALALIGFGSIAPANIFSSVYESEIKKWLAITDKEEYYADLFSAMYQLPTTHAMGPWNKMIVPNKIDKERLQKLTSLEQEVGKLFMDPHPSPQERAYASLKAARAILNSGEKINPSVKKYCEWIEQNYSSLDDTNLEEIYQSNIFDPKEANDLDTHLQNLVDGNNVTVTEYAK